MPSERYVLGLDPFDYDATKNQKTMSLGSVLVLDLWTDRIVAEYTGRPMFADDLYEIVRKLCLFYNGKTMYEAHPYSQEVIKKKKKKLWKDINIGDIPLSATIPVKIEMSKKDAIVAMRQIRITEQIKIATTNMDSTLSELYRLSNVPDDKKR